MCDRLISDQSDIGGGIGGTEDHQKEDQEFVCQSCAQNRQSSSSEPELSAAEMDRRSLDNTTYPSDSVRHRLQVIGRGARKLFTSKSGIN